MCLASGMVRGHAGRLSTDSTRLWNQATSRDLAVVRGTAGAGFARRRIGCATGGKRTDSAKIGNNWFGAGGGLSGSGVWLAEGDMLLSAWHRRLRPS